MRIGTSLVAFCCLLAHSAPCRVSAFVPVRVPVVLPRSSCRDDVLPFSSPPLKEEPSTAMLASLASIPAMATTTARSVVRTPAAYALKAMLVSLVLLIVSNRSRIFYPGSLADPSYSEPLPPGTMGGCPWIGSLSMFGNMNKYISNEASKLGRPKIWRMFGFGRPLAVISGSEGIKKFLSREFKKEGGVSQATDFGNSELSDVIFGTESMSFEKSDPKKYRLLQRLVGQALTPDSVAKGMPSLQKCAEESVSEMLASESVVMEDILRKLTLDVAWRQIIGLNLKGGEEIAAFRLAVGTWLKALTNYFLFMLPIPRWVMKTLPSYKAKQYLNQKIEERIDELEASGPDGSTMSAMIFATDDEEDGTTMLSRQQVIDNTFLLIIAGSETSSNTLINVMLLLGMHPGCFDKLAAEQEELVAKHGADITKSQLDDECPYLDGVVREAMRLLPISFGGARQVDDTLELDGYQIPKGYLGLYSMSLTHEQDPKTFKEDGSHMDIKTGFKPERWMNEETRPTTEFMPFGAGHRFCLGHTLAMAEMKTFLAVMARKVKKFHLVTDTDKMKWKEGIIITPKDGVVVAAQGK